MSGSFYKFDDSTELQNRFEQFKKDRQEGASELSQDDLEWGLRAAIFFNSVNKSDSFQELTTLLGPYIDEDNSTLSDKNRKLSRLLLYPYNQKLLALLYPLIADEILFDVIEFIENKRINIVPFPEALRLTIEQLGKRYGYGEQDLFLDKLSICISAQSRFDIEKVRSKFEKVKTLLKGNKSQALEELYNTIITRITEELETKGYFAEDLDNIANFFITRFEQYTMRKKKPLKSIGEIQSFESFFPEQESFRLKAIAVPCLLNNERLLRRHASLARLLALKSSINPAIAITWFNSKLYIAGNAVRSESIKIETETMLRKRFALLTEYFRFPMKGYPAYAARFLLESDDVVAEESSLKIRYLLQLGSNLINELENPEYGGLMTLDPESKSIFVNHSHSDSLLSCLEPGIRDNPVKLRLLIDFLKVLDCQELSKVFTSESAVFIPIATGNTIAHAEQIIYKTIAPYLLMRSRNLFFSLPGTSGPVFGISKLCCRSCYNDLTSAGIIVQGTSGMVFKNVLSLERLNYVLTAQGAAMQPAHSASQPGNHNIAAGKLSEQINRLFRGEVERDILAFLKEPVLDDMSLVELVYRLGKKGSPVWAKLVTILNENTYFFDSLLEHLGSKVQCLPMIEELFAKNPGLVVELLRSHVFSLQRIKSVEARQLVSDKIRSIREFVNPDSMSFASFISVLKLNPPCFVLPEERESESVYLRLMNEKHSESMLAFLNGTNQVDLDCARLLISFYKARLLPSLDDLIIQFLSNRNYLNKSQKLIASLQRANVLNECSFRAMIKSFEMISEKELYVDEGAISAIIEMLDSPIDTFDRARFNRSLSISAFGLLFLFNIGTTHPAWQRSVQSLPSNFLGKLANEIVRITGSADIWIAIAEIRPQLIEQALSVLGNVHLWTKTEWDRLTRLWINSGTFINPDMASFAIFRHLYNPDLPCFKPGDEERKSSVYIRLMECNLPEHVLNYLEVHPDMSMFILNLHNAGFGQYDLLMKYKFVINTEGCTFLLGLQKSRGLTENDFRYLALRSGVVSITADPLPENARSFTP